MDGFDVDWEFPAWIGADDRERIHFVQLLQELRKEFDRSGQKLLLTVAVAAPQAIVDQSYSVPEMAEYACYTYKKNRIIVKYLKSDIIKKKIFSTFAGTSTL